MERAYYLHALIEGDLDEAQRACHSIPEGTLIILDPVPYASLFERDSLVEQCRSAGIAMWRGLCKGHRHSPQGSIARRMAPGDLGL